MESESGTQQAYTDRKKKLLNTSEVDMKDRGAPAMTFQQQKVLDETMAALMTPEMTKIKALKIKREQINLDEIAL